MSTEETTVEEQVCPCGSYELFAECCGNNANPDEVEEAIVFELKRHRAAEDISEHEMWRFAESVSDRIWRGVRLPMLGNSDEDEEIYAAAGRLPLLNSALPDYLELIG